LGLAYKLLTVLFHIDKHRVVRYLSCQICITQYKEL
jgi:hypothetical protein